MRLFVAVKLNDNIIEALTEIQGQLRICGVSGNYTKEENLHLTLAFIGEYPDADKVLDVLENISFRPFRIKLDGYGCFGDLWWVGTDGPAALEAVVRRIRRALADAGIPFDRKRFVPHITVLRKAVLHAGSASIKDVPSAEMLVESISLMRSDRGKNGMIYTEVGYIEGGSYFYPRGN